MARPSLGMETNEPYYRQGDQLKRQGRYQEALAAYLKVIEKRNEDAPESQLEAGLIYQQYLKDPIYAIYHFRKYLELEPNSRQADWCGSGSMPRCAISRERCPPGRWRTR